MGMASKAQNSYINQPINIIAQYAVFSTVHEFAKVTEIPGREN